MNNSLFFIIKGSVENVAVWQVTLDPVTNVHPFTVNAALKAYKQLVLQNVIFGDVWFCSGQSNMKFTIKQVRKLEICSMIGIRV